MFLEWTVVVDDGTRPFGPNIQVDPRRPLRMVISEDTRIEVSLINPVGGVVLLGTNDVLILNGRTLCAPQRQLFSVESTPISGQRYLINFVGDDTRRLEPQRGTFDLWIVRDDGSRACLIPLSELVIAGSALGNNHL